VFAKTFAASEGLLPESQRLRWFNRWAKLELGIAGGLALVAVGLVGSLRAVLDWSQVGFGALDPTRTLREVIPSVVAFVVGIQVLQGSFFLSVLRLRTRPLTRPDAEDDER